LIFESLLPDGNWCETGILVTRILAWFGKTRPVMAGLRSWAIASMRLASLAKDARGAPPAQGLRFSGPGAPRQAVRLDMVHDHLSTQITRAFLLNDLHATH
jgi:hypothetical protein